VPPGIPDAAMAQTGTGKKKKARRIQELTSLYGRFKITKTLSIEM
jgi:hypothetical protein